MRSTCVPKHPAVTELAVVERQTYDFEIHPLAKLFPAMPDAEFAELKADIAANKQAVPITLSADRKTLLDGRHRLRACMELGIEPKFTVLADDMSPEDFIFAANVLRRHLSDDQRAVIVYQFHSADIRTAAKERQRLHGGTAPGQSSNTDGENTMSVREAIAEKAEVTEYKVRQIERVSKNKPELLDAVRSGHMTLKDADAIARSFDPPPPVTIIDVTAAIQPEPSDEPTQLALFEKGASWELHWQGMPHFEQKNLMPYKTISVHFENRKDMNKFSELVGQKIGVDTPSIWYPPHERVSRDQVWVDGEEYRAEQAAKELKQDENVEILDEGQI